ncbi:MAG: GGDEF domain-containing protein, partial [Planctomycetota bacterium]
PGPPVSIDRPPAAPSPATIPPPELPESSMDLPRQPAPVAAAEETGELGDIDLVDALLQRTEPLAQRALRIIAQQTGWEDVRLVEGAQQEAAGAEAAQVEVALHDRRFGWLRSHLASAEALRPWAGWLARWLALERTLRDYQVLAYQDDLTGAWNRRYFEVFLTETLRRAGEQRRPVTVMVFDIDNFKLYNDKFGHQAGDVVLIETVRLLTSVIRRGDRVCRMGGDEFAVIFSDPEGPREAGSTHPSTPELIAARFQEQIRSMRFPKLGEEAPGPLTISAGLATYPWDGTTPQQLADCADRRALQSKRKGKNAITLGPSPE